ncbi:transmembrane protein 205-like [Corticium candelabrum]|uniref:transmembrane protein 205-like n=1 Tax=Corticium candelabrum TaxID=121492 RepID=UPI002E2591DE|nr:transmembrane protein 205-like [Corticium candelabrum]
MSTLFEFGHLVSYSFWFGAQSWLLGVQGFVLRATVTRHQFGHIQSRLFPVFFRVGTIATLVSIGCFAVAHPLTAVSPTEQMQYILLGGSLVATLLNQLWLGPASTHLMMEYHMIEKEEGLGDEIKTANLTPLDSNKKYQHAKKAFFQYHSMSALALVASLGCLLVHGFYLCQH